MFALQVLGAMAGGPGLFLQGTAVEPKYIAKVPAGIRLLQRHRK